MAETNWDKISSELSEGISKKQLWRTLRQFKEPDPTWLEPFGWLWQVKHELVSDDKKALKLKLHSGQYQDACETVLLRPRPNRFAVCLSTQVGCAVACRFCATGKMGFQRNLSVWEIVEQFLWAGWAARKFSSKPEQPVPLRNVVFMGMGEPLDNLDHVLQAIAVLKEHNGAAVPISKITVSTVGRLDGLAVLRERILEPGWHRLNLAVSLNAPSNAVRSEIMPVNRAMPMERLQAMLAEWPVFGGGKLCLEYVLIPGVNDSAANAAEVAAFVAPIDARYREVTGVATPRVMVNLIPYNPRRDSPWAAPDEVDVDRFLGQLTEAGAYAKRRRTKGRQMMGACGQLGSEHIRRRRFVGVSISGER